MLKRLVALLRHERPHPGPQVPPRTDPHAERLAALEATVTELLELRDGLVERELKWAEMNAQLRRYLGRLDAHAGHAARRDDDNPRAAQLSAVLAAKFPNGVPSKGG